MRKGERVVRKGERVVGKGERVVRKGERVVGKGERVVGECKNNEEGEGEVIVMIESNFERRIARKCKTKWRLKMR